MVARRFKIERRPVDTNANCPLSDLPAMIPDFPSNFTHLCDCQKCQLPIPVILK
jgi:hypothetical protein